jgi:hypothetical protein
MRYDYKGFRGCDSSYRFLVVSRLPTLLGLSYGLQYSMTLTLLVIRQ